MDIRTLKNFLALADNLHFGRASADCHISLSALSRNIKQLEGELGALLFNRDNRSVVLTRAAGDWIRVSGLLRAGGGCYLLSGIFE